MRVRTLTDPVKDFPLCAVKYGLNEGRTNSPTITRSETGIGSTTVLLSLPEFTGCCGLFLVRSNNGKRALLQERNSLIV